MERQDQMGAWTPRQFQIGALRLGVMACECASVKMGVEEVVLVRGAAEWSFAARQGLAAV